LEQSRVQKWARRGNILTRAAITFDIRGLSVLTLTEININHGWTWLHMNENFEAVRIRVLRG